MFRLFHELHHFNVYFWREREERLESEIETKLCFLKIFIIGCLVVFRKKSIQIHWLGLYKSFLIVKVFVSVANRSKPFRFIIKDNVEVLNTIVFM